MKTIKNTTKQGKHFISAYNHADNSGNLEDVYKFASVYKYRAIRNCKSIMESLNGFGAKIISYNSNFFTYAFKYIDEITGVIELAVITAGNSYVIDYI